MTTDTSFIPVDNPDLTGIDSNLIGVPEEVTTQSIQARGQPFTINYDTATLTINKAVIMDTGTFGNIDLITPLPNPNLDNQLVIPQLQVGGSFMANEIVLGNTANNTGVTQFLSNTSGTYIYNNLNVAGVIQNTDLQNKLDAKVGKDKFISLSYIVDSKVEQTYLMTNYYNKNQSDSLLQGKANSNNVYSMSQIDTALSQKANTTNVYTKTEVDVTFQTKADMHNYPTFDNIADLDTTISSLSSVYQPLGSYITTLAPLASVYQPLGNYQLAGNYVTTLAPLASVYQPIGSYVTIGSSLLIDIDNYQLSGNYLTDASVFQLKGNYLTNASLFQASGNYLTTFTPLSGTYLSIIAASNTYQPIGSYVTIGSNLLVDIDNYQVAGNYLTDSSVFQLKGSYLTTFTPLTGTYLSIINASSTYQPIGSYVTIGSSLLIDIDNYQVAGNYLTDSSVFQLSGNYVTTLSDYNNAITSSSLFQLKGNYLTNASLFQASGSYLTDSSVFQLKGNYLTDSSVFQAAGNYITTLSGYNNALTSSSLFQLQGQFLTSSSLLGYQLAGNYITTLSGYNNALTNSSLFQLQGQFLTSGSLTAYQPVANMTTYVTSGSLAATYAPINNPTFTGTVSGITPAMIGLNNVRPWVAGYIWNNGASVSNSGVGQYNATSSKTSTGVYVLTFPTVAPKSSSNLTCIWSPNTSGNFIVAMNNGNTQTTATVMLRDSTNTAVDAVVSFVIWCAA